MKETSTIAQNFQKEVSELVASEELARHSVWNERSGLSSRHTCCWEANALGTCTSLPVLGGDPAWQEPGSGRLHRRAGVKPCGAENSGEESRLRQL